MTTPPRQVSVLVTAYRRPHQLREALASIALQDRSLIGEIVIGDDSPPQEAAANFAEVQASGLAHLIKYHAHSPPKGCYPNHWFLAEQASFDHLIFLHDDDHFCPGAIEALVKASLEETDSNVKLWFGRNLIMDEQGRVDAARSAENNERYGRGGPGMAKPMWQWCIKEAVPPNSFLVPTAIYRQFMRGERDGNVGDWGFNVRLANSGASGRYIAQDMSHYRVQASSSTSAGAGLDSHRWYELLQQLEVPPETRDAKRTRAEPIAPVAVLRYVRDGERARAWRCYLSSDWSWPKRLSLRGAVTLGVLLTPRVLWYRFLHYRA